MDFHIRGTMVQVDVQDVDVNVEVKVVNVDSVEHYHRVATHIYYEFYKKWTVVGYSWRLVHIMRMSTKETQTD